jgi:hypothetical protein
MENQEILMNFKKCVLGVLFLMISSTAFAENKFPAPPDDFQKQINEFEKKEVIYINDMNKKQMALFKELEKLKPALDAEDQKKREKAQADIKKITQQLSVLIEDIANHEVESAAFNIKVADYRLKKAQENLKALQEKKKQSEKNPVLPKP